MSIHTVLQGTFSFFHHLPLIVESTHGRGGCQKSIWSTPKNPHNHADAIRRFVDHSPHQMNTTEEP
jgi:hypothetical protein